MKKTLLKSDELKAIIPNINELEFRNIGGIIFDNIQDAQNWHRNSTTGKNYRASSKNDEGSEWSGGLGYNDAVSTCGIGCPKLGELIAKKSKFITMAGGLNKISPVYDVAGSEVDIPRMLSNMPESMIDYRIKNKKRTIKIVIAAGASGHVEAEKMGVYGAALGAIVKILMTEGFGVELGVCDSFVNHRAMTDATNIVYSYTPIIKGGETPSLSIIGFWIAHAACFRRLGFRVYESFEDRLSLQEGYGIPLYHTEVKSQIGFFKYLKQSSKADILLMADYRKNIKDTLSDWFKCLEVVGIEATFKGS